MIFQRFGLLLFTIFVLTYIYRVLLVLPHRHQAKILEHPQNENFLILLVHTRLENSLQEFKPLK